MILSDNHIHSCFSSDSTTSLEDIANTAISLGLESICITDHHDIDFVINPAQPQMNFQLDTANYLIALTKLKENYTGRLDIRFGVELGLMSTVMDKVADYLNQYQFDFIIGSSHLVNGLDPFLSSYYEGKTDVQAYREYFESILENINLTKDYDVYGHLDYVVRYGPSKDKNYFFKDYIDIFEAILKKIINQGKGIEVNTAGLYKGLPFPHPKMEILALYKQLGGEIITIGSDAHLPKYLGHSFSIVNELLLNTGFEYYSTFKNRKPYFHPLT